MPTKTTKKTTTKTVAKKTVAKKTAPKKVVKAKKSVKTPVATETIVTPDMMQLHCGHGGMAQTHCNGHCGAGCACGADCKCNGTHKSGCGHFFKKFVIALVLLAIGAVIGMAFHCPKYGMRGPRIKFADNGCMIEESVKCPKLREALPAMDINQDGCITREEFRAVKKQMRQEVREIPVQEEVVPEQPVEESNVSE